MMPAKVFKAGNQNKNPQMRQKGVRNMAEFIPPSNWHGVPNIENYAKWCEMLVSQKVGYPVEATVKLKAECQLEQKAG